MKNSVVENISSYLDWFEKGLSGKVRYVIGGVFLFLNTIVLKDLWALPLVIFLGPFLIGSPAGVLANRELPFYSVLLMPFLYVALFHKRPWWSVGFRKPKIEGWNLGMGILVSLAAYTVSHIFFAVASGGGITFTPRDPQVFLPLFLVGLVLIFMQSSAEEVTFRGYLMQATRRFTANPFIIILVNAVLFGLPHFPNVVMANMPWYIILVYIFDGAVYAWLAYRSRSLWMPIGWHFMNNIANLVYMDIQATGSVLNGQPLFVIGAMPSTAVLIFGRIFVNLVAVLFLTWLLQRREGTQIPNLKLARG